MDPDGCSRYFDNGVRSSGGMRALTLAFALPVRPACASADAAVRGPSAAISGAWGRLGGSYHEKRFDNNYDHAGG